MPTNICLAFIAFLPSFTPGGARLVSRPRPVRSGRGAIFGTMAAAMVGNWAHFALSIRKRPHPQFLLADLPQAGKACRLGDKKEHDQGARNHECQVLNCRGV